LLDRGDAIRSVCKYNEGDMVGVVGHDKYSVGETRLASFTLLRGDGDSSLIAWRQRWRLTTRDS
jgi:hypothetical protein